MNIQELHKKAQHTAQNYLKLEKQLLQIIIEIDKKRAFRHFGYSSLYTYVQEALKLSPAVTYNFIKVARKSHEIPELKDEVVQGRLSISKATKMTAVLTQENHKDWFRLAAQSTYKTLEREVALASPNSSVIEKT